MGSEDQDLTLGLGFPLTPKSNINYNHHHHHLNLKTVKQSILVDDHQPHLTLSLSGETLHPRTPCSAAVSAASSLSNNPPNGIVVSVKRERETASSEDFETERGCNSRTSDEEEDGSGPITTTTRKKLRLTKDQSTFLEDSFKKHCTLNPKQKQALADRLNLRPRQVEVWFQNRRARTKLKQTEVDCEYLKKWCETLTDENKRLHKEVQELKALKVEPQPLYMHLPAATLTMCPSCERVGGGVPIAVGAGTHPSKASFTKPHFYTSFPNPSAAC